MPSKLLTVAVPATAGNSTSNLASPPDGHKYLLHGLFLTLVCDATVANRTLSVNLYKAATATPVTASFRIQSAATASQTKTLSVGKNFNTAAPSWSSDYHYGMEPLPIDSAVTLNISVTNGVAGDSFSGQLLVEDVSP